MCWLFDWLDRWSVCNDFLKAWNYNFTLLSEHLFNKELCYQFQSVLELAPILQLESFFPANSADHIISLVAQGSSHGSKRSSGLPCADRCERHYGLVTVIERRSVKLVIHQLFWFQPKICWFDKDWRRERERERETERETERDRESVWCVFVRSSFHLVMLMVVVPMMKIISVICARIAIEKTRRIVVHFGIH